jgi:hypothetical protein
MSDAGFAPIRMRLPHPDDLLLDGGTFVVQLMRHPAFERFQAGIPELGKAGFPVVEQASTHSGFVASSGDTARFFPGLEQQLALLRGAKPKVCLL